MSLGAKRYPRRVKIGHNAWANYGSSGKRTSTTHKIQNVTTTIAAGKTRKQTTNLGGGLYQVIGGKSTLGKKPKPSKVRTSKSLHTTFPTTPAVTVKPNRLKPIPRGRPGRGGALIWSWILMPLFSWLFSTGIRLLFSSDRRAREIDDDQQESDDYEQGEPIEAGSPDIPPPLPELPPMDLSGLTDEMIEQTIATDDLDEALHPIREFLDPDHWRDLRDRAEIFVSDDWPRKTSEERLMMLDEWLCFEDECQEDREHAA